MKLKTKKRPREDDDAPKKKKKKLTPYEEKPKKRRPVEDDDDDALEVGDIVSGENRDGEDIEGKIVKIINGKIAVVKDEDNARHKCRLSKLTKADEADDEDEADDDDEDDEDDEPKSKKKSRKDEDDEEEADDDDDWMIQGREAQRKELKRHESEVRRNSDRAPELWIRNGEARKVQFLSTEPLAMCHRYTIPVGGKRFEKVTAPRLGKKDLMLKAGLRSSLVSIYPVVDKTGYTDKKGKRIKNRPCLLVATGRTEKKVEKMREKKGDITRLEVEYSRTGDGTDTEYQFFIEGNTKPYGDAPKMLKDLKNGFKRWYKPPTEEEQRVLLNGAVKQGEEDDD